MLASSRTPQANRERTPCDSPQSTTSTSSCSTQHPTSWTEVCPTTIFRLCSNARPAMWLCSSGAGKMAAGPVVTPFGGAEHDWTAIEVAAWLAQSLGTTLRLLGTEARPDPGRRDASRLLARASLLVQQVVGIVTEPVLVRAGQAGVLEAASDARLLVVGLSDRWRTEGLGPTRLAVALGAQVPTLFVRRGLRPRRCRPKRNADAIHLDARVRAGHSARPLAKSPRSVCSPGGREAGAALAALLLAPAACPARASAGCRRERPVSRCCSTCRDRRSNSRRSRCC